MKILLKELHRQREEILSRLTELRDLLNNSDNLQSSPKVLGLIFQNMETLQRRVDRLSAETKEIVSVLRESQRAMTANDLELIEKAEKINPIDWASVGRLINQADTQEARELLRLIQNTLYRKEEALESLL